MELKKGTYEEYAKEKLNDYIKTSPQATEVKEGNAIYYRIEDNNELLTSFVVFKDDSNWITLNEQTISNKELFSFIKKELSKDFSYITLIIPIESKILSELEKDQNIFDIKIVKQEKYEYKNILIKL